MPPGRLSARITEPLGKDAAAPPIFATLIVQIQGPLNDVIPPKLLVLVAVKSGGASVGFVTVTESLQELLALLFSGTVELGSAMHAPPVGFTKVPVEAGAPKMFKSNAALAAMLTAPPGVHIKA